MADELTSIDLISDVVRATPLALFSDIDGTLSPIVDDPSAARVPDEIIDHLRALAERGAMVALVTGRSLEVARRMVDLPGVAYAAAHGVDLWVDGRSVRPPVVEALGRAASRAIADLRSLEKRAGIAIEDKGFGLSVHYRQADDPNEAHAAVLAAIAASRAAGEFELHEGRMLVELRPKLGMNKGTAVAELVERFGAGAIICLGDDITDIDMFQAARRLGSDARPAVSVAARSDEADPSVLNSADYWVDGVDGIRWLLGEIVRAFPRRRP
ncbi:MAG: trehalose-phosphatase [Chloroflexi bacterium]|nr:trehalose-phosphatase [Chloroflexota bacterium]